jgi:hypothetical protein
MKTLYPEELACLIMLVVIILATSVSFLYIGFKVADILFG